ncbi:hypothetical protein [Pseudomonas gingeri]|uniref:hypothetical protein n=1 Tax=Pseudomonas gingeri TaxID=117681 RepID=UPI0015A4E587|nr:hypothetical protein [Pseudomonas gingeri]NWA00269.1 hypothetical protein [Pseudomonas gingeri]NWA12057.1 hypothetical protein [Pseudomonas gingeri]NWA58656.1 hypothetical protein [Pseudomonas gingeri]NWA98179.1 hypothetical protein [Pseudomonas gingeri]NWB00449.1 hypothetical protein [Pseudomonas gingeri]
MSAILAFHARPTSLFHQPAAEPRLISYREKNSIFHQAPELRPDDTCLGDNLQGLDTAPAGPSEASVQPFGAAVESIMQRLQDSLPCAQRKALEPLQKLRAEALPALRANDPGSLGKQELQALYRYFKTSERVFANQPRSAENRQRQHLCRVLKWQFRASLSVYLKNALDQALAKSRATVGEGGSQGWDARVGLQIGTGALGGASIGPNVGLSSTLETTQTRIIKDTTSIDARLKGRLSLINAVSLELGLGYETIRTEKYSDLDTYTRARSLSKWTWWNGSKRDLLSQGKPLFSTCNNYQRNIRLAALSQAWLGDELRKTGNPCPRFDTHQPLPQPFQIESGRRVATTAAAIFDGLGMLRVQAEAKADVLKTGKAQALDIIGVYDRDPAAAEKRLDGLAEYGPDAQQLISAMQAHVIDSSHRLTRAVLDGESAPQIRQVNKELDQRSRQLTEQYVHLKLAGTLDTDADSTIRQLLEQHPRVFRPDALKLYTARADTLTRTIAVEPKAKLSWGVSLDAGMKISLSSVQEDDPHLCGTYLDIAVSGQFNTLESVQKLLANGLASAGVGDFDTAPLVALIGGTVLYQSHGASAKFSLKLKDGEAALLMTQHFFTQKDAFNQAFSTPTPVTVEAASGSQVNTLLKEQLGSQSLDLILPIALSKLAEGGDIAWWDGYVDKHAPAFDALLNNIAETGKVTLISRELAAIREKITAEKAVVDQLIRAAQAAHDRPDATTLHTAREALKAMLTAYINDYYEAKVKEAWSVT